MASQLATERQKRRSMTTTSSNSSASRNYSTPALPATRPSSRSSRPTKTPRRITNRRWNRARRSSSCWTTTPSAAPFDGVVGDVPVHVGDYATTSTMLTTVDESQDLEAYIYIPTERASEVRTGLAVDLLDNSGKRIETRASILFRRR